MSKHTLKLVISLLLGLTFITNTLADDPGLITPPGSASIGIELPDLFISDFPGEHMSVQTQKVGFRYTDISIPGPNGLDINVNRSYARAWAINPLPKLRLWGSTTDINITGCLGNLNRLDVSFPNETMTPVGFSSAALLPTNTVAAFSNGSIVTCDSNGTAIVRTATGLTYTFGTQEYNSFGSLWPTSVEDRFGNKINYTYETYGIQDQLRLISIFRNDNVTLNFSYNHTNPAKITSISYGQKSIVYNYSPGGNLKEFIDEEGNKTEYIYRYEVTPTEGGGVDGPYLGQWINSVILPTGAKVEYGYWIEYTSPYIQAFSGYMVGDVIAADGATTQIASKRITGPDIKQRLILYKSQETFEAGSMQLFAHELSITNTAPEPKIQTIYTYKIPEGNGLAQIDTDSLFPDNVLTGTIERIEVRKRNSPYTGNLNFVERDPILVSETIFDRDYVINGNYGCPAGVNVSREFVPIQQCSRAILKSETKKIYNPGGTNTYTTSYLSYDQYGSPTKILKTSANNTKHRYASQTYLNDKTNWLLGLPLVSSVSDDNIAWKQVSRASYWPETHAYKGKPQYSYAFARWTSLNQSYHPNGDLKKVIHNGTTAFEQYDNYKLGTPQTITVRDRYSSGTVSTYRTIDNYGNTIWEKDFNGNQINYTFDKTNRLTKKDYLNTAWSDIIITYVDELNYIQTITGNLHQYTYVDAIGRVKTLREEDILDPTTKKYQTYRYDKYGRTIFVSYPSPSSNPLDANGINYEYDALWRKTKESIPSTGTVRTWEYWIGNQIRSTDGKGNLTRTLFESFGGPDYSKPILSVQKVGERVVTGWRVVECDFGDWACEPEVVPYTYTVAVNLTTSINYNVFGNLESVIQGGISENYFYDAYQQLCKKARPDVGNTTYGYNAQRQMIWEAKGTTTIATGCDGTNAADKINYSYDNQGSSYLTTLSDGSILAKHTLDANGNLVGLQSKDVNNTYTYNDRNYLTHQTTTVDGVTYPLIWTYNSLGQMKDLTYPDNRKIAYTTNALGQQTSAGNYATGAKYHPTGGLSSFYFGNGLQRSIGRDTSGLPANVTDSYGLTVPVNLQYTYDKEFNVTNVYDNVQASYELKGLTYDPANRLTGGTGHWGAFGYHYDTRHNLTKAVLGTKIINYNYNANNRLDSITGTNSQLYTYDNKGNVTSNGLRSFNYNNANQMTSSQTVSFKYDGRGLRTKKLNGTQATTFIYAANGQLLHKILPDGSKINYVFLNGELVAQDKANVRTYLHNDVLGSVVAHTNASRTVTKRYHYEPFGKSLETGQKDDPGYTGHLYDAELGLNYMKARFYDPNIGRFYSNDPVGFTPSNLMMFNRYAYANNNPYIYLDSDGNAPDHIMDARAKGVADSFRSHPKETTALFVGIAAVAATAYYGAALYLADAALFTETSILVGEIAAGEALGVSSLAVTTSVALKQFGHSIDDLSGAAAQIYKNTDVTEAGRALSKHATGQRSTGSFPPLSGSNKAKNAQAQQIVDNILGNPDSTFEVLGRGGLKVTDPSGKGIRFEKDGSFSGFTD